MALDMVRPCSRIAASTLTALSVFWLAPTASADATTDLRSRVDASRSGACAPLQSDPVLDDVARRANDETNGYILHTAQYQPFEDPMPVLHDLGYNATKAKLLVGYGDSPEKAIKGVVTEGFAVIPDCSFTKYGLNTYSNGDQGYVLAALVLAAN